MATYAVIGLGRLGYAVATSLAESGAEVIAVDEDAGRVDAIKDHVARAICFDATDERALRASGVQDCAVVILAMGENQLEQSVLTTMLLRDLGVGRIIARASTDVQAKVLDRLGVSRVIFPERQIGIQVARQLLSPSVREIVPISEGTALAEIEVPPGLIGKSLGELQLRREFGLNAVGVRRRREVAQDDGTVRTVEDIDNLPGPETRLGAGDVLLVVGPDEKLRAFAKRP
jgi:trk system potassium uptake protein